MNDSPNLTPDTTPVPAPDDKSGGTAPQSVQQVNWESRYNGLNSTYGKLQKKFEDLTGQHQQTVAESEELRQTIKKFEGEKATMSSSLQAIETEKSQLIEQAKAFAFNSERMKLIMGKFPELASFEADGLLPSAANLAELEPKLEAFRNKLGANVVDGIRQKMQGAGPAQSGKNDTAAGGHSEDYIYARLNQLGGHRTPAEENEYQLLRDEWDALHKPA